MYLTTPRFSNAGHGYGEVIEAVGLGVALFSTGQQLATSGSFSNSTSSVNYIHERTPLTQAFRRCSMEFSLSAHHPRPGFGRQTFWYNLTFEYNGNDLRNVSINSLVHRSSSMTMSSFSTIWSGQPHSPPAAPVAEVMFQLSGRWDPVGRGDVSFRGELKVSANGTVNLSVTSEAGGHDYGSDPGQWVRVGTAPVACARVAPWTPPPPAPAPTRVPIVRTVYFRPGSDQLEEAGERALLAWFNSYGPLTRASIANGGSAIQVEGFASTTQGGPANLRLSRRRAEKVAQLARDALGSGTPVTTFARGEYQARTPDRVEAQAERRAVVTLQLLQPLPPAGGVHGYGLGDFGVPCLYGRWCGPGCSGPGDPIDELDSCCKNHDQCYSRRGYFNCGCDRDLVSCVAPLRARPGDMGRWAGRVHAYFSRSPCRGS